MRASLFLPVLLSFVVPGGCGRSEPSEGPAAAPSEPVGAAQGEAGATPTEDGPAAEAEPARLEREPLPPDDPAIVDRIRHHAEHLQRTGHLTLRKIPVAAATLIPEVYADSRFERVWRRPEQVAELEAVIEDSFNDGLDPEDYHRSKIDALQAELEKGSNPSLAADLDVLLTDAAARLAFHLYYGKVDPQRADWSWNLDHEYRGLRGVAAFRQVMEAPSLSEALGAYRPQLPAYGRFRRALALYRDYAKAGGWEPVEMGKKLEVGMTNGRVPGVRKRLAITGDLPASEDNGSELYDGAVAEGVHAFQRRHHLDVGPLDNATAVAMSIPVKKRIDQLRVNIERARWILRAIEADTFVLVNLAAFEVYFLRDHELVWKTKAQVGKKYRATPLFVDEIEYLVLNPTWTVPPGVLDNSLLPKLRANPGYLAERGLEVRTVSGEKVDPNTVDWSKFTGKTLPYRIRQGPGPENYLGDVKFMLPNKHNVYLHDTPNQAGYEIRLRTMSQGCVHVQDPLKLAELLLADDPKWDRKAIDAAVDSGKTETIHLEKPMPVLLLYWTAAMPAGSEVVEFYQDIYGRDKPVLKLLDGRFRPRQTYRRG